MPHLYTSIPCGRQALCMKNSHISLQFNIVLLGFPPHLKQYSSLFVGSQIWHLNTPSTICACVRHLTWKCLAGLHEPSHILNGSEPSHFFAHLMHSITVKNFCSYSWSMGFWLYVGHISTFQIPFCELKKRQPNCIIMLLQHVRT